MLFTLELIAALALFLIGLHLSAFFSGAETGFYRVGFLRLSIDAKAGDDRAERLIWYSHNPGMFVATTLVGNNVANYLTTVAIGIALAVLFADAAWWLEIVATLLLTPVIFLFGEQLPKNLYYRAPLTLLRQDIHRFHAFYYLFLPLSLPLIAITKLFERFSPERGQTLEVTFGRGRLSQVLKAGQRAGLVTETQTRVVNGVLQSADQPIGQSVTPASRVLGLGDNATREQVLNHAAKYGLAEIPLHRADAPHDWYGYVRLIDVHLSEEPIARLARPMVQIDANEEKLDALLALRESQSRFGRVVADGDCVGVLHERGLIEQLFRPRLPVPPG